MDGRPRWQGRPDKYVVGMHVVRYVLGIEKVKEMGLA